MLAAIKTAKYYGLGPDDVVVTVATDGAAMYGSERETAIGEVLRRTVRRARRGGGRSASTCSARRPTTSSSSAASTASASSTSATTPGSSSRACSLEDFEARRDPRSGRGLREIVAAWDGLIDEFNARTGVLESL